MADEIVLSLPYIFLYFKNIKEIIFFIIRKKLKTTYARNRQHLKWDEK